MTYDGSDGYVLLFGGEYNSGTVHLNDTWKFENGHWTQLHPAVAPSPRYGAFMAYDAADGYVVLFGGTTGYAVYPNDTWEYKAGNWTQLHPSTSPSGREGGDSGQLVYDSADGYILLFGGENRPTGSYQVFLNDTWEYKAGVWTELHSTVAPPEMWGGAMTYDSTGGYVLLFGGSNGTAFFNGTWEYHGGQWNSLHPTDAPSERSSVSLTYDSRDGFALLFGGANSAAASDDTWDYSGGVWTELRESTSPSGRWGGPIAYDLSDGYALLFGGVNGTSYLNDTWTFTNLTSTISSVSISPSVTNVVTGGGLNFTAIPVCPASCPASVSYYWSLNDSLGSLNVTSGSMVRFTAGNAAGEVTLFVNATLNGVTKQSAPASVTITGGYPLGTHLIFDTPNSGPAPLSVTMTGNATGGIPGYAYSWIFGDGSTGSGVTVTHTYTTVSNFTVSMTAHDARGNSAMATGMVTVLPNGTSGLLRASIIFDTPSIGYLPFTVTVIGSATGGTSPYGYAWTFGDRSSASGVLVSHTYQTVPSGCTQSRCTYPLNLTVSDSAGRSASASASVVILTNNSQPLAVTMTDSPASGMAPLLVNFSANVSGGQPPYAFTWAYGDGFTGTGAASQHTYSSTGIYTVVLVGVDANGKLAQVTSTVVAYPPPGGNESGTIELKIIADPVTGPAPFRTHFQASAQGGKAPYVFNWSFGDGSVGSVGPSVFHTYATPGEYVATIVATDSHGNQAASGVFVTVTEGNRNPSNQLAVFVTALNMHGNAPLTITFTPAVRGGSAPYLLEWSFGDGTQAVYHSNELPVTHSYSKPGTYVPTLTVTDANGDVSNWSAGAGGFQHPVTVTGNASQPFPLFEWVLIMVVVAVLALVLLAFMVSRRKRRPQANSKISQDSDHEIIPTEKEEPQGMEGEPHPQPLPPTPPQM